ncbi:hypothetical protein H4S02_004210, partial [Coemansia sp. RSA 2611]
MIVPKSAGVLRGTRGLATSAAARTSSVTLKALGLDSYNLGVYNGKWGGNGDV